MMSLQMSLLLLGVLLLLAMAGYYGWQARKSRPRQAEPTEPRTTEHEAGRIEPHLNDFPLAGDALPGPAPEKKPGLDALIDAVAPIALEAPLSGEAVLVALPSTRRVGSKPFAIEGLNAATQRWEPPTVGQTYSQLQAGVQLANRSGALNDIEFSEFVMKTQNFCDAINGTPDLPVMRSEVNRARELDQFASGHDAQLVLMVQARRVAWSPSYIQQTSARHGFVMGSLAGRLVMPASTAGLPPVVSLSFDALAALADDPTQSALRQITLGLDVAQVDRSEKPFERLRAVADALAQDMDGVVTDDQGATLSPDAMTVIAAELEQLYDILEQHELAAGSPLARRLFS
ncbi:cell division protein ZipA C-terminal FtsZ-binding domain-containing protein [Rhodoferax sp.]|uniref:cell division protein ZipA C-terminal FtsZ-binding domain-containing protein n=1 Tax=Rhodoferax sp. TaxID=50421 RepID=UPI002610D00B|nr:cell division protein ZipA C-terminal FtsZ-binding domain-containing protein [Rhodoferax sp.]MDD2917982.1 cell division protein ZipA C-terminal FtsZ-binding domain-containing protein [Rhodoferax sp.]